MMRRGRGSDAEGPRVALPSPLRWASLNRRWPSYSASPAATPPASCSWMNSRSALPAPLLRCTACPPHEITGLQWAVRPCGRACGNSAAAHTRAGRCNRTIARHDRLCPRPPSGLTGRIALQTLSGAQCLGDCRLGEGERGGARAGPAVDHGTRAGSTAPIPPPPPGTPRERSPVRFQPRITGTAHPEDPASATRPAMPRAGTSA